MAFEPEVSTLHVASGSILSTIHTLLALHVASDRHWLGCVSPAPATLEVRGGGWVGWGGRQCRSVTQGGWVGGAKCGDAPP